MNKAYEERVKNVKEKVSAMSDADIQAHIEKIEKIYRESALPNRLGNFEWDTENDYYWNTYDSSGDMTKLNRRLSLGWSFATREDAVKSGLASDLLKDVSSIDGETTVEMSHKSCRAVLLKIPKSINKLNKAIKERIRNNKQLLDSDGNVAQVSERYEGDKRVEHIREKTISLE
jgi:hypothetical protein